jgi:serine O-acetyltransferase
VPPNSVVIGVPGQVVVRSRPASESPDLEHGTLPDTIGAALRALFERVDKLERRTNNGAVSSTPAPREDEQSHWRGQDFSI